MAEIAPVPAVVKFVEGSSAVIDDIVAFARSHPEAPFSMETFFLGEHAMFGELTGWSQAGRSVSMLVNPHAMTPWNKGGAARAAELAKAGVGVHAYAPDQLAGRAWLHSKIAHVEADAPRTWVHNTVLEVSGDHTDLGIVVEGMAAERAAVASSVSRSGDPEAMARAIDDAAESGIVFNDFVADRQHATSTIRELLGSRRRLYVATKAIDDIDSTRAIIGAHRAGADVSVVVRDLAPRDADLLRRAEVPTTVVREGEPRMHHTVIHGDGLTYVGSAYPWRAMLEGDAQYGYSRDAGVLLDGDPALEAVARSEHMIAGIAPVADLASIRDSDVLASQHDWIISRWPNAAGMRESDVERALREMNWRALGATD